jgi:ribosomal protein L9
MKVKLLRDCKPFGRTGEIAEVSPAHFEWVTSLGYAVPVTEARERAEAPKAEKPAEKPAAKPAAKKTTKSSAKK